MTALAGRILYIENDASVASLFVAALSPDHTVEVACTAQEGLDKYRASSYDVVASACGLPDMSGLEIVDQLLSENEDQSIVLVTRLQDADKVAEIIARGVLSYVSLEDEDVFRALLPTVMTQAVRKSAGQRVAHETAETLRQSRQNLFNTVSLAGIGYWEWDIENQCVLHCSEELADIFHMTQEEYIENAGTLEKFYNLIHPDDFDRYVQVFERSFDDKSSYDIHYRIVPKEGSVKYVVERGRLELGQDGEPVQAFGTVQDVTDSVNAETRRIEDQKALQASEARHKRAARIAKVGHWAWDEIEDRTIYSSDLNAAMFGLSTEEYCEKASSLDGLISLTHPEDRDAYLHAVTEAEQVRSGYEIDFRIMTPAGEIRHLRELGEAALDAEGNHIQTVGVTMDISDTVGLLHDIAERDIQLEQALQLAKMGSWVWSDREEKYEYVSSQYAQLFGYSVEEYTRLSREQGVIGFCVHPEDVDEMRRNILAHDQDRESYEVTYRGIRKDGAVRAFRDVCHPVVGSDGVIVRSIGCTQDITDFIAVQDELRETQISYRWAAQVGKLGHFVWDQVNDVCEYCSDELAQLYGVSAGEFAEGRAKFELFEKIAHPDDREWYEQYIIETEKSGKEINIVFRIIRDGKVRYLHEHGQRVLDDQGRFVKTLGFIQDVTEAKENEQALLAAREDAESANRLKSEFLAHMSHELRTPLNAITGFSKIITEQMFGQIGHAKYLEYANDIHDSGQHLLAVINDILDLSKIEAGEIVLHEEVIDPWLVIKECVIMLGKQVFDSDARVTVNSSDRALKLRADERIFKQVVLNLLSNADKFTTEDGRIEIVCVPDGHGCINIVVTDTGIGIAEQDIPKVLEPFGQARSNSHLAQEGSGIGLSLSKRLMELHGGSLELASELGVGTEVTLKFPRHRTVEG